MSLVTTTKTSRPPKTESTWQQGANAFRAGLPVGENPYRYDPAEWDEQTLDHIGWGNGYRWARQRKGGER